MSERSDRAQRAQGRATSGDALLTPGAHRAARVADDDALVAAMLRVEVAWLRALGSVGAVGTEVADAVDAVVREAQVDVVALARAAEAAGNPVPPLVTWLRGAVADAAVGRAVHRGLTSQDVLDTALVLVARDALVRTREDLAATAQCLGALADAHRGTVMVGRTLTQHAVPITFGLKVARWLDGILDAVLRVDDALVALRAQCGGAAGTLALVGEITENPAAAAAAFADELGLVAPALPWHTNRAPVTRTGDALVAVCDALGVVAGDVALMSRPELGELAEGSVAGRGGSSTMPHKRNPVLSVLVRSAAMQAPLLGAQLHLAAAQAVDERPDGAWHSEWPALQRLLVLAVTAASQGAELVGGLQVDVAGMAARADAAADDLLAERGRPGRPSDYLGAADRFVDAVLGRLDEIGPGRG